MIGKLVKSKSGHDKDCIYIVVSQDDRFAYVADGLNKSINKPKKKNKKHLQIINLESEVGSRLVANEKVTDEEIKRFIKQYIKEL